MAAASDHSEIVIAGLLFAIAALVTAARVLNVPYPVFLVLGGLGIGLIPGLPEVRLAPDLVLLLFLPPLLYAASFFASLRDLRQNVRPISLLAVGLVLATCVAVAAVAHAVIDGISWPLAFVLGAVVSPTDPVAATAIAGKLGVPRRIVTIIEGESLINDATAIVAYKVAVTAVVTGSFSAWAAGGQFLYGAAGGVAIGLAVGYVVAWVRERLHDPPVEITISLLTSYAAYLPAEELGLSGVVAAVTVGLYMGSQTSRVTDATVRMQGDAVWQILVFLLNSFLFVLVGLQLRGILDDLGGERYSTGELALYGGLTCLTVVVIRFAWVYLFSYLSPAFFRARRGGKAIAGPRYVAVVGWMGMRGAVSLAAALSLPVTTEQGARITERPLIQFIVFCVILATLVVQGLSLPAVVRVLGVTGGDDDLEQEARARLLAAEAALERIEQLTSEQWAADETLDRLRGIYNYRRRRFASRFDEDEDYDAYQERSSNWTRMMITVIEAQREALELMRSTGDISDDVLRTVVNDLDLEERRLAEASS
ncbi:MAG: Na+/H+ antiporter [Solirubrobacteraceae bacterium]